jgi:hypothetical protein
MDAAGPEPTSFTFEQLNLKRVKKLCLVCGDKLTKGQLSMIATWIVVHVLRTQQGSTMYAGLVSGSSPEEERTATVRKCNNFTVPGKTTQGKDGGNIHDAETLRTVLGFDRDLSKCYDLDFPDTAKGWEAVCYMEFQIQSVGQSFGLQIGKDVLHVIPGNGQPMERAGGVAPRVFVSLFSNVRDDPQIQWTLSKTATNMAQAVRRVHGVYDPVRKVTVKHDGDGKELSTVPLPTIPTENLRIPGAPTSIHDHFDADGMDTDDEELIEDEDDVWTFDELEGECQVFLFFAVDSSKADLQLQQAFVISAPSTASKLAAGMPGASHAVAKKTTIGAVLTDVGNSPPTKRKFAAAFDDDGGGGKMPAKPVKKATANGRKQNQTSLKTFFLKK